MVHPKADPKKGIITHILRRPPGLIECPVVYDFGVGIRPMNWYTPERYVCVEPYSPYCEILEKAGYEVRQGTALTVLQKQPHMDAAYFLDSIEHMEKDEGLEVIRLAKELVTTQIVVFTPRGFLEQTEDAWGYGGHYWQTHRSGWMPKDFPGEGWTFRMRTPEAKKGFTAVWTKPKT